MKHLGPILIAGCLLVLPLAEAQDTLIGRMTEFGAKALSKHPVEKKPEPPTISTLRQNKNVEIYRCDLGRNENRYSLEISWSDGEKSFLSFRGQEYKLNISYRESAINKPGSRTSRKTFPHEMGSWRGLRSRSR